MNRLSYSHDVVAWQTTPSCRKKPCAPAMEFRAAELRDDASQNSDCIDAKGGIAGSVQTSITLLGSFPHTPAESRRMMAIFQRDIAAELRIDPRRLRVTSISLAPAE